MQVSITARHCDIDQALRERVNREVQSLTKVFDRIIDADVVLAEDSGVARADVVIHLYQHVLSASGQGVSPQQAFAVAIEKVERQLRKFKGKLLGRRAAKEVGTEERGTVV